MTATTSCSRAPCGTSANGPSTPIAPKRTPFLVWRASSRFAAPRKVATQARRGPRIQFVRSANFQQPSQVHHADPISERKGFLLIVRDEHGRDPQLSLHLADGAAQLLADLGIERAEGLIRAGSTFGLVCQRARHRRRAAAGRRRSCAGRRSSTCPREPPTQQPRGAAPRRARARDAPHAQREFNVVGDRHCGEERVILKHEADIRGFLREHMRERPRPCSEMRPVIYPRQARDRAQQRAFCRCRWDLGARRTHRSPIFDRHVVDDGDALITFGDLIESDRHAVWFY